MVFFYYFLKSRKQIYTANRVFVVLTHCKLTSLEKVPYGWCCQDASLKQSMQLFMATLRTAATTTHCCTD